MLSPKHLAFANHVLTGKTAVEAYQLAGYSVSAKVAAVKGAQLLARDDVKAYIAAQQATLVEKTQVTLEFLSEAMLEDMRTAKSVGDLKNSLLAANSLAKLHGFSVTRIENVNPFKDWTANDLARFKGIVGDERRAIDSAGSVH